ncbi:MAG: EamA family transporter [Nanobdellota archaeon]
MLSGFFFGLLSMLGFGISDAIVRVPSNSIGTRKTIYFRNLMVSLFLLIALFFMESSFSWGYVLFTLSISLLGYIALASFYRGMKTGKVGVVSPIANSSFVFTVLFSVIFFKENLGINQVISIIGIVIGVILLSVNFRELKESDFLKTSSGVPFALLTCFLWGLLFFLFKIPVNVIGPALTAFVLEFGVMVFSGLHSGFSVKVDRKNFKYLMIMALLGTVAILSFNIGITMEDVSIVAAVTSSSPLVTAIYGNLVYKEKMTGKEIIAVLLIITGLVII